MKKAIGIIVIFGCILLSCAIVGLIAALGVALIWAAFHYQEIINMVGYGVGANIAEKLTGEKYIR